MNETKGEVTRLLLAWSEGDAAALNRLMPLVLEELRQMAKRYLDGEDPRHTLQPTALVNEVYLRLVDRRKVQWRNQAHFFGFAAQLMRRILVDHARKRQTDRRGKGSRPLSIEALLDLPERRDLEVLLVDEALTALAREDERQARIVEMRFFAGLNNDEIAEALGVSATTVKREWATARLWLLRELSQG
ncbi:MAG TPA: sigma-70 family RNA polymerase sigma factor [Thermoanaerobaculia bacterium]